MKILVTGATGYIGRALSRRLIELNHSLIVLSRNPVNAAALLGRNVRIITHFSELQSAENIDAIINLAGEPIAGSRWTPQRKKILEQSRIDLTADLIALIHRLQQKPVVLISGSAVGYYGDCGDRELSEFSEPHDEFSHRLCAAWEMQALRAKVHGVRVCIVRTGVVIGRNASFLQKLLPLFRLGLGAQLGSGRQYLSWIHINDLLRAIIFLLNDSQQNGIYNATAPNPLPNKMFTRLLASVLHRPTFMVLPEAFLKLLFGEMSRLLITGQRVLPMRLEKAGFRFEYNAIRPALEDACK